MKKTILSMLALAAALIFSAPAKAQYTGSTANNPCNTALSDGFSGRKGSGTNGAIVVRFYIQVHYNPVNLEGVKKDLAAAFTDEMNSRARSKGYNVRVEATDFDNPSSDLNMTIWLDIYDRESNGDSYQVYTSVGGWGQGHLFKFYTPAEPMLNSLTDSADGLIDRLENGWTCNTQQ